MLSEHQSRSKALFIIFIQVSAGQVRQVELRYVEIVLLQHAAKDADTVFYMFYPFLYGTLLVYLHQVAVLAEDTLCLDLQRKRHAVKTARQILSRRIALQKLDQVAQVLFYKLE